MPNPTDLDTQGAYAPGTTKTDLQDSSGQRVDTQNAELEASNAEKLRASGQIPEGTPDNLAAEATNMATYGIGNPKFASPVISSADAAEEVDGMANEAQNQLTQLSNQGVSLPQYEQYKDHNDEIQKARDDGKSRYEQVVDTITKGFDLRTQDQEEQNRMTTGFQTASLARMGAYGTSVSGMSFLKSVEVQNQRELTKIQVEKAKALIMAQESYAKQDWTMLVEQMDRADKLTDQANQIQQWMFDDKLRSNEETRTQMRFGWDAEDRAMGKLDSIVSSGMDWDSIDQKEIEKLEKNAGLPTGYFKGLYDTYQFEKNMSDEAAKVDLEKKIADLRNVTPEGQSFKIGDNVYTGWDKTDPNTWESTFTDGNGNVTLVVYDRLKGTTQNFSLGNIGAVKDGWTLENANGALYRVNAELGVAEPVLTRGNAINPSNMDGFDDWAASIGTVSVPYGGSTGFESVHPGYDIAGKVGTPITAFQAGTVTAIVPGNSGFGNYIEITDSEGRVHRYSHLQNMNVVMGQTVGANDPIGTMGNTGQVMTSQGTGKPHEPSAEERAAGAGAHLDYRVFTGNATLATDKTKTTVSGIPDADLPVIQQDMTTLRTLTDPEERRTNYLVIRDAVAGYGADAVAWFDKVYPGKEFGVEEDTLPKLGEIEDLGDYSAKDLTKIIQRDLITWDQLKNVLGDFSAFDAKSAVDLAWESGATYEQIKGVLAKGGIGPWGDRWTSEVREYADKKFENGPKAFSAEPSRANTNAGVQPSGSSISWGGNSYQKIDSTKATGQLVSVPMAGGSKTAQVDASVAWRLAAAAADYFAATGQQMTFSEAYRSRERQAMLYDRYKRGQGGRAAPPGQSYHQSGMAIDMGPNWKAYEPYLRRYGFRNDLADDRHHFSVGEFG